MTEYIALWIAVLEFIILTLWGKENKELEKQIRCLRIENRSLEMENADNEERLKNREQLIKSLRFRLDTVSNRSDEKKYKVFVKCLEERTEILVTNVKDIVEIRENTLLRGNNGEVLFCSPTKHIVYIVKID